MQLCLSPNHWTISYHWRHICNLPQSLSTLISSKITNKISPAFCPQTFQICFLEYSYRNYPPWRSLDHLQEPRYWSGGCYCGEKSFSNSSFPLRYNPDWWTVHRAPFEEADNCSRRLPLLFIYFLFCVLSIFLSLI